MENFTPFTALIGGLLIGTAATIMLLIYGRITGISGILGGVLFPLKNDLLWRILFLAGLVGGAALLPLATGESVIWSPQSGSVGTVLAGLLVGFGTRLGSGCTSGHGICGIARLSRRSVVATGIFILVAMVTVYLLRQLTGIMP